MIANRIRKDAPLADSPGSVSIRLRSSDDVLQLGDGNAGDAITISQVIPLTFLVNASSVDSHVFVADGDFELVGVRHVVSTGASGASLDIKKTTGTTAPASGTTMLSGTLNLNATANTSVSTSPTATTANKRIAAGERISFDFSGTLTNLVGAVTLYLKRR